MALKRINKVRRRREVPGQAGWGTARPVEARSGWEGGTAAGRGASVCLSVSILHSSPIRLIIFSLFPRNFPIFPRYFSVFFSHLDLFPSTLCPLCLGVCPWPRDVLCWPPFLSFPPQNFSHSHSTIFQFFHIMYFLVCFRFDHFFFSYSVSRVSPRVPVTCCCQPPFLSFLP